MFSEWKELKKLKQETSDQKMIVEITKCQKLYLKKLRWLILSALLFALAFGLYHANSLGIIDAGIGISTVCVMEIWSFNRYSSKSDSYNESKKLIDSFFATQSEKTEGLDKDKELKKEKDVELQQEQVKSKLNSQEEIAMEQKYDSNSWQQLTRDQKLELLNLYKEQVKELEEKEKDVSKTKVIRK